MRAKGTSLGADNGIGVAYALALLESRDISHPPLEALFTSGEEIGMIGASRLQPSLITGRKMLNLDSEEEGYFVTGCAGGLTAKLTLKPDWEFVPSDYESCQISIKGLKGGHSGVDIEKGRGNAIRLLGRLLFAANQTLGALVGQVSGGGKSNAIPDRAQAIVFVKDIDKLKALTAEYLSAFKLQLLGGDDVDMIIEPCDSDKKALTEETLNHVLLLLLTIPNGVQTMSQNLPGLVESSNNIGILRCSQNEIAIICAIRSSKKPLKLFMRTQITALARAAKAELTLDGDYPEWDYAVDSPLRDQALEVYRKLFKTEPVVYAIHAGLECGYFKGLYPDMDIISTGPNLYNVHTPQESMDIESAKRVWEWIVKLMLIS
jgi:dipeptidase D